MANKKATATAKKNQPWGWTWESPRGKIVREAFGSKSDAHEWAQPDWDKYQHWNLVKVWLVKA